MSGYRPPSRRPSTSAEDSDWTSEPGRYRFPSSQRYRWERVRAPIEGLGPVGDSVASFHPLYGQGMSSAALQAVALRDTVADCGPGPELVRAMAARSARIVDNPWTIATGGDFMYPDPRGQRPKAVGWVNRYLARVMRAAAVDPMVNDAFCRVFHLLERPESLFRPAVAMRVAAHGNSRQEAQSVNQVGQVNSTG